LRNAVGEVCERNDENTEIAEVFTRIHGDLMEGFSSLVSMNLNALVRTLTEITIALAVPAIIVGLWGMNVPTPFENDEIAFAVLSVLVVALAAVTFLAIRYAERIGPRPSRRS
jgi:magnesium transporter